MNHELTIIQDLISQHPLLSEQEKEELLQNIKNADKLFSINEFKLDRTEKVKRTTAILLEETIEELEQKRKAVEAQKRELEIEASLERVRSRAMAMQKSDELLDTALVLYEQFKNLGESPLHFSIGIFNEQEGVIEFSATWQGNKLNDVLKLPISEPRVLNKLYQAWKNKQTSVVIEVAGKELQEYVDFRSEYTGMIKKEKVEGKRVVNAAFFSSGLINFSTLEHISPETVELLERFASVFDLTYTRFLDLQKAETQAREAKIEAALERVRSRTMAMHKSDELSDVATILFEQVKALGVPQWTCGFSIFEIDDKEFTWYQGSADGDILPPVKIPLTEHPVFISFNESRKRGDELFVYEKEGEFQADHYRYMRSLPGGEEMYQNALKAGITFPAFQIDHIANFSHGNLVFITYDHFPEMHDVFKRFAKVFEQTYTRFLDLQTAEVQAREAQVEASLERIRATTMAMHKSDELLQTSLVLFEQFTLLSQGADQLTIGIVDESDGVVEIFATVKRQQLPKVFRHSISEPFVMKNIFNGWKEGKKSLVLELSAKELEAYNQYRNQLVGTEMFTTHVPAEQKRVIYASYFSKGMLAFGNSEQPADEITDILDRFAKVFEQTYTRFLDLQKAEAQAREAQIEAAVERVRGKALAMQKSEDLHSVVVTLKKALFGLNIHGVTAVSMYLEQEDGSIRVLDLSSPNAGEEEGSAFKMDVTFKLEDTDPDLWIRRIWNGTEKYFVIEADEADFDRIIKWLYTIDEKEAAVAERIIKEEGIKKAWLPTVKLEKGKLSIDLLEPPGDEIESILIKIGAAFDLAYRRFLDLLTAEAQAREAKIEAGMERVRSRAMSMQKSDELKDLIATVSTELGKLDFVLDRCFFMIFDQQTKDCVWWMSHPESPEPSGMHIKYHTHSPYLAHIKAWEERQKKWEYVLGGDVKKSWDEFIFNETELSKLPEQVSANMRGLERVYFSSSFNNFGCLSLATLEPLPDDLFEIMLRFAKVFDLTYTRFNDLKQAEAQAREAKIEAALERVRARAMAMQNSVELESLIGIVFSELTKLDIMMIGCVIIIFDPANKSSRWWMVNSEAPDEPLSFFIQYHEHIPYKRFLNAWTEKQLRWEYELKGSEKKEWDTFLFSETELAEMPAAVINGMRVPDSIVLSTSFNNFGCLNIGTIKPLTEEQFDILLRFASVFDLTYTRFNDLKLAEAQTEQARIHLVQLEAEKNRAESALKELQATQQQLIQSEKMASLGELTAGIAHEIQNPLNFVNNFSEVSVDLIDELENDLNNGETEDAKSIAATLKQNLDKITEHGKRASSIVKGMLQHSRKTTDKKEPTDINALTDEYVRLSYHGFRAKDKSFNALVETQFDESIDNIQIIPQDIGRVLLNLLNNAFYSVNEKKKQAKGSFEPVVSVTTGRNDNHVSITIKDNGTGIPEKVLNKIYQPFFTTKPTGEGTGLGLSLSYDIITKGHGGEMKVNTKEGEGAEFIIIFKT